jgi:hypothetical protein
MSISRAERRANREPRAREEFGRDADAVLDILELTEFAWHDCYSEITPPDAVVDDIFVVAQGTFATCVSPRTTSVRRMATPSEAGLAASGWSTTASGEVLLRRLSIAPGSAWSSDQAGYRSTCGNASEPSGQWWTELASRGTHPPAGGRRTCACQAWVSGSSNSAGPDSDPGAVVRQWARRRPSSPRG